MEPNEIFRSLILLRILIAAFKRPIDAGIVVRTLQDRGLNLGLSSARHILLRFERKGYLVSNNSRNGRPHTIYTITPSGRLQVQEAKRKIRELIAVFESRGTPE